VSPGEVVGHGMNAEELGRGLRSFPFQLNLSTCVHCITQINL